MTYRIFKTDLQNVNKFKERTYQLVVHIKNHIDIPFDHTELSELLLSACRLNELNILHYEGNKMSISTESAEYWIEKRLLPNTVVLNFDDEDVIRLLLFSFEITYKMFEGGTRATVTAKGFRERRRTFESIVVDQFNGKLGEVLLKRFLESKFPNVFIELDWEISRDIKKYRSDIVNATKKVSIKSTNSLAGIWAEADKGCDYGITVKCGVPEPILLQFFIEVCGFSRLINFANNKIPNDDEKFKKYIESINERIKSYKCGECISKLKGFICGYFTTYELEVAKKGEIKEYLGEVKEERYIVRISELKYGKEDWELFLKDTGLLRD